MRAIILAAGEGQRLRPHTADRPKCMVPLLGRPILDRILDTLRAEGVDDITLVTGYRSDALEPYALRTRHNPDYASTNMVHSLFCARDQLFGDVLISYGDIVYSRKVLSTLMHDEAQLAVAVDRDWRSLWSARMADPLADAETMKLDAQNNILELGKKPASYADIQGQYMGLLRIRAGALSEVCSFYDGLDRNALYDGKDFKNMYMTSFVQAVVDDLMPVHAVLVDGEWLEVDTTDDLRVYEERADSLCTWLDDQTTGQVSSG